MNRRTAHIPGYTLLELIIVLALIVLFMSIASYSAIGYRDRVNAHLCIGNQMQIFNALAEYGNNNMIITMGTPVAIATLTSRGFLKSVGGSTWSCRASGLTGLPYAVTQNYGKAPVCPGSISTHRFSVTNAPIL